MLCHIKALFAESRYAERFHAECAECRGSHQPMLQLCKVLQHNDTKDNYTQHNGTQHDSAQHNIKYLVALC